MTDEENRERTSMKLKYLEKALDENYANVLHYKKQLDRCRILHTSIENDLNKIVESMK